MLANSQFSRVWDPATRVHQGPFDGECHSPVANNPKGTHRACLPKKADFVTHDQLPPAPHGPHSMETNVLHHPPEQDGTIGAKDMATIEGRPFNVQPASVVTQAEQTAKKGSG